MRFCVLGPLEVYDDRGALVEIGGGKAAGLLTVLLLHAGEWVRMDDLVEVVWPRHAAPVSAERNLKTYVWQLRRSIPATAEGPRIESRPGAYRIRLAPGELDADVARSVADAARAASAAGEPERAAGLLTDAVALWRGHPVHPHLDAAVAELTELRWALRESLAEIQLSLGRHGDAVAVLRNLLDEDPLREGTWAQLVRALQGAGRRSEALAAYRRARMMLVTELGVEPGADLSRAHSEALADQTATPAVWQSAGPGRHDLPRAVSRLVGRSAAVQSGLAAVHATRDSLPLVIVEGMPGVGKTALALQLAHQLAAEYPDAQLYADLGGHCLRGPRADIRTVGTREVLGRLITAVTGTGQALPHNLDERAALWRAVAAGRRMLLVLDDATSAEQVHQLLPGTPGNLVLVTTRGGLTGLDATTLLRLDPLPAAEAAELFCAASGDWRGADWRCGSEPDAVVEVVRHCGRLPAALQTAGERLRRRPTWTIGRLAARLADEQGRRLELADLSARLESSYRLLAASERRMFRLLGLMTNGTIDADSAALLAGMSRQRTDAILELLLDRHLLIQPAPGRYAFHILVADLARRALASTESATELAAARDRLAARTPRTGGLELVPPQGPRVA